MLSSWGEDYNNERHTSLGLHPPSAYTRGATINHVVGCNRAVVAHFPLEEVLAEALD